jgi:hypothetical protein
VIFQLNQLFQLLKKYGKFCHSSKKRILPGWRIFCTLDKVYGKIVWTSLCPPLIGCKWCAKYHDRKGGTLLRQIYVSYVHLDKPKVNRTQDCSQQRYASHLHLDKIPQSMKWSIGDQDFAQVHLTQQLSRLSEIHRLTLAN